MKVAIAAKDKTLRSHVDDHFGRCPFFILVDPESMGFETIENPGHKEKDAAGIQSCELLISKGVDAVVVKNIGHNSVETLSGASITIYVVTSGTVLNVIEKLKKGELTSTERPTVGFQDGLDEVE